MTHIGKGEKEGGRGLHPLGTSILEVDINEQLVLKDNYGKGASIQIVINITHIKYSWDATTYFWHSHLWPSFSTTQAMLSFVIMILAWLVVVLSSFVFISLLITVVQDFFICVHIFLSCEVNLNSFYICDC